MLNPADDDVLQKWPVFTRVNSSRTGDEDATLIEPIQVDTEPAMAEPSMI